jgi:O-phospho-L-seryl-tRNASec:L-selenocysteinyl-tRNA synthase
MKRRSRLRMSDKACGHLLSQDVFITLLSMGRPGYQRLLKERKELAKHLHQGLHAVATKHGERLLLSPHNTISFAMSLEVRSAALSM